MFYYYTQIHPLLAKLVLEKPDLTWSFNCHSLIILIFFQLTSCVKPFLRFQMIQVSPHGTFFLWGFTAMMNKKLLVLSIDCYYCKEKEFHKCRWMIGRAKADSHSTDTTGSSCQKKKNQLWPIRGVEITFQGSPQTDQRWLYEKVCETKGKGNMPLQKEKCELSVTFCISFLSAESSLLNIEDFIWIKPIFSILWSTLGTQCKIGLQTYSP